MVVYFFKDSFKILAVLKNAIGLHVKAGKREIANISTIYRLLIKGDEYSVEFGKEEGLM
jgi:hypothetical protein